MGSNGDTKNQLFTGPLGLAPDPNGCWSLVSTDGDEDGINGVAMVDGAFLGFSANFNIDPVADCFWTAGGETEVKDIGQGISAVNIWLVVCCLFLLMWLRCFQKIM